MRLTGLDEALLRSKTPGTMSTLHLRTLRLALVAAGVAVAAPSFASVIPLCGDEKHDEKAKNDEKNKSEPNKNNNEKKKPTNQG